MNHLRRPFLVFSLVTSLLLVGGFFANQSAAHSLHHAHHKATTHASLICSWICAAGEIVESSYPIFTSLFRIADKVEFFPPLSARAASMLLIFERGPPPSNF